MYTSGETNVLPDFRPVCSSNRVGTGFLSPAPTRQLAPIFPPDFRYTHTWALPAYFMTVVTNGEFSCAGFLFASISSLQVFGGAAADGHLRHAELAVVPAARPGGHHPHTDPVVHHLVDERAHIARVRPGIPLPHADAHAQC